MVSKKDYDNISRSDRQTKKLLEQEQQLTFKIAGDQPDDIATVDFVDDLEMSGRSAHV